MGIRDIILQTTRYLVTFDKKLLFGYFNIRLGARKYNRYFQSMYTLYRNKDYCYCNIRECFCVFKFKQIMNIRVYYLAFAPFSLSGSLQDEKACINMLLDCGITVRLTGEELLLYNINKNEWFIKEPKESQEFIYDSLFKEISQVDRKTRWNIKKPLNDNKVKYISTTKPTFEMIAETKALHKEWCKFKKVKIPFVFDRDFHFDNLTFNFIYEEDTLVCFSAVENSGQNKFILLNRIFNYEKIKLIPDITRLVHYIDINSVGNESSLYNIGVANVSKGLLIAKTKLKPVSIQIIYSVSNKDKIFIDKDTFTLLRNTLKTTENNNNVDD